jgi:hypothetical protein
MGSGNKVRFPRYLIHVSRSTNKHVGTAKLKFNLRILPAAVIHLLQLQMHAFTNAILHIAELLTGERKTSLLHSDLLFRLLCSAQSGNKNTSTPCS